MTSSIGSNPPEERHKQLAKAAAGGHEKRVRQLVEDAKWTSQLDRDTLRRALQSIAAWGNLSLSRFLVLNGAGVNRRRDNEVSALFRAAENGRTEVVQLLLGHGADTSATDRYGRTALHLAVLRGYVDVVKALLKAKADVDARDKEGRTPLIHLIAAQYEYADTATDPKALPLSRRPGEQSTRRVWKKEEKEPLDEEMVAILLRNGANIEAQDDTKRTLLQWTVATGKIELAKVLLSGRFAKKADVAACNERGRNSLHLAAETGRDDFIQTLLDNGANPRAASDGGWTPLHNAAQAGAASSLSLLLNAGADVNAELSNGMTALHWASYNGHIEVVKLIVAQRDVNLSIKDSFDRTALLCAAEQNHDEVCLLLSPGMTGAKVQGSARSACEKFEATVVDFGMNLRGERQRVFKHSVFELLYGWDDNANKAKVPLLVKNIKHKPGFRWVHLPANNVSWVETLLAKYFVEAGHRDIDDFKALQRALNQEHRGPLAHAHFMRPSCQKIHLHFKSPASEKPVDQQPIPIVVEPEPGPSNGPLKLPETLKTANMPSDKENKDQPPTPEKPEKQKKKSNAEKFAERHSKKPLKATDGTKSPKPNKQSKTPDRSSRSPGRVPTKPSGGSSKIVLFIPFLHYETDERREKMANAIKRAQNLDNQNMAQTYPSSTADDALIEAYLRGSPPLHIRRTLDQFFYHGIDTTQRDRDQVVYRYCKNRRLEPRVFMVDQCWLWILGNELVVTSFPQRWQQPKNDPLNVLDGIIEDMNAKTRPPIKSVYDLAMLITSRCSGMFDRHRLDSEDYQFLDMFESSIGHVTNEETRLFDRFNRASAAAGKWLKIHRRPRGFGLLGDGEVERDPRFQDALLDIGVETRLLAEIKDIRDELNMIRMVLKYQEQKLPDFADVLIDELGKKSDEAFEIRIRSKEQLKIVKMHVDDIERMDRQAASIYANLLSLLDLKQKHANAFEARFGRDQAAFSARSSKTIMVFTIVTIVFLPLSFIAAFFAINIQEFPHGTDGSQALPLGYVSKYTFGIGLTISLPLIALAFAIDDIATYLPRVVGRVVRRMRGAKSGSDEYGDGNEKVVRTEGYIDGGKGNFDFPDMPRKSLRDFSTEVRSHSRTTQVSWARRSNDRREGLSDDLERGRLR